MFSKLKRLFLCLLYYGFAQYLPASYLSGGALFRRIRYLLCKPLFLRCGKNVNIERCAFFYSGQQIEIGDHSGIGENARISGKVSIGQNVMMGPNVTIWTQNHDFSRTDISMNQQGFRAERPVTIQDDVWIGSHVIILAGVTVGRGAILGAGAVVAEDVP